MEATTKQKQGIFLFVFIDNSTTTGIMKIAHYIQDGWAKEKVKGTTVTLKKFFA